MAAKSFDIELTGQVRVLEALAGVDKQAAFAQRTALRAAGRRGRSLVAKATAARLAVPLKVFKNRIRFFNAKRDKKADPVALARLWMGLASTLKASEHAKVDKAIRLQNPKGFEATMRSGHRGWYYRTQPSRRVGVGARTRPRERGALPVKEHTLDYQQGAEGLLLNTARQVMKTTYPDRFRADYKRRIDKIRARNR